MKKTDCRVCGGDGHVAEPYSDTANILQGIGEGVVMKATKGGTWIAVAVIAVAMLAWGAGEARAHYGDVWFQTRGNIQIDVRDKYRVTNVKCAPLKKAHKIVTAFGSTKYDHFDCNVYSTDMGHSCWVIVHVTGQEWYQIVLTTSPPGGCTPADVRRR